MPETYRVATGHGQRHIPEGSTPLSGRGGSLATRRDHSMNAPPALRDAPMPDAFLQHGPRRGTK